ncbi:DUF2158 domain-containing protein [Pseudomonas sp. MWU16-30322]|uniref:DUF2158 domain-containing protein n=1 Tax=Pseudomonas sp. MWU16-30322 TaxID=2878092 RepID=UPI001CFC0C6F
MSNIEKGDVVALKSGGPSMTVNDIVAEWGTGEMLAKCTWFNSSDMTQHENFALFTLKKIDLEG